MAATRISLPEVLELKSEEISLVEYVHHPLFESDDPVAAVEETNPGMPAVAETTFRGEDFNPLIQLCAAPMLTKPQERYLFTKMNLLKFQAGQLIPSGKKKLRKASREKIIALMQEAIVLRNTIVESNLRLVASIARNYVTLSQSLEDAISEGFSPLMRAVELFDCSRGLAFSTYATHCVKNALGRSSTRSEKRRKRQGHLSPELVSTVAEERSEILDPDPLMTRWRVLAGSLIQHLDPRERQVVSARFGLEDDTPHSYEQIGQQISLSKERVRQISIAAIEKLRKVVEEESIDMPEHTLV